MDLDKLELTPRLLAPFLDCKRRLHLHHTFSDGKSAVNGATANPCRNLIAGDDMVVSASRLLTFKSENGNELDLTEWLHNSSCVSRHPFAQHAKGAVVWCIAFLFS